MPSTVLLLMLVWYHIPPRYSQSIWRKADQVTEGEAVTEAPEEVGWVLSCLKGKVQPRCAHRDHTSETQTVVFSLSFPPVLWYGWPKQGRLRLGVLRYPNSSQGSHRDAAWSWGGLEGDKAVRAVPNHNWGLLQGCGGAEQLRCVASPQA